MKVKNLALVSCAGPLILAAPVRAGYTGLTVVEKPNELGLLVCNIYAVFDRPGEDRMQAVAGTAVNPLLVEVIGGTFFQHSLGDDLAPLAAQVDLFSSLAFDTFVTIGAKLGGLPEAPDETGLTPTWPGFGLDTLAVSTDGWFVTPLDAQGDPFNPAYVAGDGQILLAQFSAVDADGDGMVAIGGTWLMQYRSNGVIVQSVESFFHVPGPATFALLAMAGLSPSARRRR